MVLDDIRKAAKALAISYHGFHVALAENDDSGILAWGSCLRADQAKIGVELVSPENIGRLMGYARAHLKRQREDAAVEA